MLTTHAILGRTVASVIPAHPILAMPPRLPAIFYSNAIPHSDYPID